MCEQYTGRHDKLVKIEQRVLSVHHGYAHMTSQCCTVIKDHVFKPFLK